MRDLAGHRAAPLHHALCVVILALLAGCGGGAAHPNTPPPPKYSVERPGEWPAAIRLPLRRHEKHLYIRASVNGEDAGWFLFDTGAAMNVISPGLANRLELPKVGSGTARGIAGREDFDFRQPDQLTIGPVALEPERMAGVGISRMSRNLGLTVNGIIGFHALRNVPFTVDYQASQLILHNPDTFRPEDDAEKFTLRIAGRLPVVEATLGGTRKVWLLIDTGADNELTLPRDMAERWPDILAVPQTGSGSASGVGGSIGQLQTWTKSLHLFGIELSGIPTHFEGNPGSPAVISTGRLGDSLLQHFRLTFDARNRAIWAQWRPEG